MIVKEIGDAKLYLADCRDVIRTLGHVDAVITDPPFGVNFKGKPSRGKGDTYASYEDTTENFEQIVIPALTSALDIADRGAVFMADKCIHSLPPWASLGGIYLPHGVGLGSWGFQNFMHVVFYGNDPYLATRRGSRPNGKYGINSKDSNDFNHPCAKSIDATMWAVERASLPNHLVLDPFMGSGTTGVASVILGRRFIGIEIDPEYYELACERVANTLGKTTKTKKGFFV